MTGLPLYAITAGLLFALGLYGLLTRTDLIHRLLGANIMLTAVFLFLVVFSTGRESGASDPVPQVMVLTGIVIAVSVSAFALSLLRYLRALTGRAAVADPTSMDAGDADDD